jgi:predicted TIM-barrel fold metal-dependent hydrolase
MWASDWPFAGFEATMSYETALGSLADWVPDPEMRAAVAGGTALRFYFA